MKKIHCSLFIVHLIIVLGLSVTGCLETTREIPITMTVSASALHFPFSGEKQKIMIDSNTNAWELTCDASWITFSPSAGAKKGVVTVSASSNSATENLSATITITGTGIPTPLTIPVSIGAAPMLIVTPSTLSFNATDTPKLLTVASNTNWNVSNSAVWLNVAPMSGTNDGTLTVTATSNTSVEQRAATVSVSNPDLPQPQTITVSQSGTAPSINIEMVQVSGGTFIMGCTSEQGNDCIDDEKPSHSVTLSTFYIGKFEVTQGEWEAVMGNNPSYFQRGDNYPVENVSWNDIVGTNGASMEINGIIYYANGFIYKLNQMMTGIQYRLPTEAEWEYAARGGQSSRGNKYSGSNTVGNVAWYGINSDGSTQPVGTKTANELGIYDMSGNVMEWCSDWYSYYYSSPSNNPIGPSTGSFRVNRGGSWNGVAWDVRVSVRFINAPDYRYDDLGLRLACSSN